MLDMDYNVVIISSLTLITASVIKYIGVAIKKYLGREGEAEIRKIQYNREIELAKLKSSDEEQFQSRVVSLLEKREKDLDAAWDRIREKDSEINTMRGEIHTLKARCEGLEVRIAALEIENEELRMEVEGVQGKW